MSDDYRPSAAERECRVCRTPTIHIERKPARFGLVREICTCTSCGSNFETFNPIGHAVWWGVVVALVSLMAYGFGSGRMKSGDAPMIVLCMLTLLIPTAYIGARALLADRRNPRIKTTR